MKKLRYTPEQVTFAYGRRETAHRCLRYLASLRESLT